MKTMNFFVVDIRNHFFRELFVSSRQTRRYVSLSHAVQEASNSGSSLCHEFRSTQETLMCRKQRAPWLAERYAVGSTGRPPLASSRSRRSQSCVFRVSSGREKSFLTLSRYRSSHSGGVDMSGNGNGNGNENITDAPQIDFSRISRIIKSDRGVVDASSIWYVVATAALLGLNRQSAIEQLWKYISDQCDHDKSKMLAIARRIREACLKSSVLVGFPHVSRYNRSFV